MLEVTLSVVEHKTTETVDKASKYVVRLKGKTVDSDLEMAVSIKGDKDSLFDKYALGSEHAAKISQPQSKLG